MHIRTLLGQVISRLSSLGSDEPPRELSEVLKARVRNLDQDAGESASFKSVSGAAAAGA